MLIWLYTIIGWLSYYSPMLVHGYYSIIGLVPNYNVSIPV